LIFPVSFPPSSGSAEGEEKGTDSILTFRKKRGGRERGGRISFPLNFCSPNSSSVRRGRREKGGEQTARLAGTRTLEKKEGRIEEGRRAIF